MTGIVAPAATAAATTATLWFLPLLMGAVSFYQYDKTDPEGRPKDTKVIPICMPSSCLTCNRVALAAFFGRPLLFPRLILHRCTPMIDT